MAGTGEHLATILAEINAVFVAMAKNSAALLAARVLQAWRVMLCGVGRNSLAVRGFAMRLAHLVDEVHLVDEWAAPPVGPGDLFLAAGALGRLPTTDALAPSALNSDARPAFFTAIPDGTLPVNLVLHLPTRTMAGA